MASQGSLIRGKYTRKKNWRASVKFDNQWYHLGYYKTRQEAEDVENRFRLAAKSFMSREGY